MSVAIGCIVSLPAKCEVTESDSEGFSTVTGASTICDVAEIEIEALAVIFSANVKALAALIVTALWVVSVADRVSADVADNDKEPVSALPLD